MHPTETFQSQPIPQTKLQTIGLPLLIGLILLFGALWNLGGPPMWWDEGWTLSVARTWVERGNYGRLLDGQPAPPGLEAAWPLTALVGLSFKQFGVGLWQGRLPGVFCIPLVLAGIFILSQMLYSRRMGWGAVATLLLLSMHPQLHPFIQGRQVLGELPMFACLTFGLICVFGAVRRSLWLLIPALPLLAFALLLKGQTWPFLMIGIFLGGIVALVLRRWRFAAVLATAFVGSSLLAPRLSMLWFSMISEQVLSSTAISGLIEVTGFVPSLRNRIYALSMALMFALTTMLGLGYAAWKLIADLRGSMDLDAERSSSAGDLLVMRSVLLGLAGSWFAWFLLLSVGVPRYMFPATFVGSIFVAVLLHDLTGGFRFFATLRRCTQLLQPKADKRRGLGALLAVVLIAATLPITLLTLNRFYLDYSDDSAQQLAAFLNETPPDTRIETYESELHFLLNRPYHWPPDQVHVELNHRGLLGLERAIEYDSLVSDPDYLVVGVFARGNELYQPVIDAGAFRLLRSYGDYELYERVR